MDACVLCGEKRSADIVSKAGWQLVECRGCRLLYVCPQPTQDQIEQFYARAEYHAERVDAAVDREPSSDAVRDWHDLRRNLKEPGRLLDIGCSTGDLLLAAQKDGWEAEGVELNPRAVRVAQDRGLKVQQGIVEDDAWPKDSFDAITMLDVIEHAVDPLRTLKRVASLLKVGGTVLVRTPRCDGLFPRVTRFLMAGSLGVWEHPEPPAHLFQFSSGTLRALFEKSGLELSGLRSEEIPPSYTTGKLEEAIINRLKNREVTDSIEPVESERGEYDEKPVEVSRPSFGRFLVRSVCWGAVLTVYPVASLLRAGNQMVGVGVKSNRQS